MSSLRKLAPYERDPRTIEFIATMLETNEELYSEWGIAVIVRHLRTLARGDRRRIRQRQRAGRSK